MTDLHQEYLESIRIRIADLIEDFETKLRSEDLRPKVLALIPVVEHVKKLGMSLIPQEAAPSARARILFYFRKYPRIIINGDELLIVSGIQEWARRVRELRVQFGWNILSGVMAKEMAAEDEFPIDEINVNTMKPYDYILVSEQQDRDAAHRWHTANEIRKRNISVRDKILAFLRAHVGRIVTGEELRYVAKDRTEWARRVRELRTEFGWPIATKVSGRPDLPVGVYILEADRQSPEHDRKIPDPIRRSVLRRDQYRCRNCHWEHSEWNPSDPRHLEIHHVKPHVKGGDNFEENLWTLCTICHDELHRRP